MSKGNKISYFTIIENRAKKNGLYPVCLVVSFNGTKKRYRTDVEVSTDDWKKIKSPKLRDEDLKVKRSDIHGYIRRLNWTVIMMVSLPIRISTSPI